jgi:hypothetical protein
LFSEGLMQATSRFSPLWTGKALFFLIAISAAFAAVLARVAEAHLHLSNPRLEYGLLHLPAAFLQIAIFAAGLGLVYSWFLRRGSFAGVPSHWLVLGIVALFAIVWLPVTFQGGFAQDDWMLLSAASVRKVLYAHPLASFNTLDTVDGNYRPLGTVLYVGYALRWFGLHPFPFLLGNFFVGLICVLLVFAFMRELRQTPAIAAAAAVLFLSRDLIYTPIAWLCALGDSLAIFGSGLSILLLLRALRSRGVVGWLCHFSAWVCFAIALFAKQSAFAVPLIAVLAILICPAAEGPLGNWKKRLPFAALVGGVYGATVLVVFRHAVHLLDHKTPYPITLSPLVLKIALSHVTWFFLPIDFPDAHPFARLLVPALGLLILIGAVSVLRRRPDLLGPQPKLVAFLLAAGFASISLFLLLPNRSAAYYGSMAAFWICMAVAIVFGNIERTSSRTPSSHLGAWLVCLFVLSGYSFVRLKQTGLLPSGGYTWGTYNMADNMQEFTFLREALQHKPDTETLVLVGEPSAGKEQANMAILAKPSLKRILSFDPKSGFKVNDHQGRLPQDGQDNLHDVDAYHWTIPLDDGDASAMLAGTHALWIRMDKGDLRVLSPEDLQTIHALPQ